MAKQGASYEDIIKTEGEEGEEQENNHGNTRLPFGLCARYGIPLPEGATPRDAWNALKGKGIYPPWTEEGKDQYDDDESIVDNTDGEVHDTPKFENGEKISIGERKHIYDEIRDNVSSYHSEEYTNKVNAFLENLDDDELLQYQAISKRCTFTQDKRSGGAWYSPYEYKINTYEKREATLEDSDLGFDWGASTFGHECGHAIDYALGAMHNRATRSFAANDEQCRNALQKDAELLMQKLGVQYGIENDDIFGVGIDSSVKISGKTKEDMYRKIGEITGVYTPEMADTYEKYYELEKEIKKLKRVGDYGAAWKIEIEQDNLARSINSGIKQRRKAGKNLSFYTDFIGNVFKGRLDVVARGFSGHDVSYNRDCMVGEESFAEFCSAKSTKNKETLNKFKELMPNTFARFDEIYATAGKTLAGR